METTKLVKHNNDDKKERKIETKLENPFIRQLFNESFTNVDMHRNGRFSIG